MKAYSLLTKRSIIRLAAISALVLPGVAIAQVEGFTEVPITIYGKVLQISEGSSTQLNSGTLTLTLVSETDESDTITLTSTIGGVGSGGFSYRLEVPQFFSPAEDKSGEVIAVATGELVYRFGSIAIDGVEAIPLVDGLSSFTTSFANRGQEVRVDLAVSGAAEDSDEDGLPNWWEDVYGLNRLDPSDASGDLDGDTWDNFTEFQQGTNPAVSNTEPVILTTELAVPSGGLSGFYLQIFDSDSAPEDVVITLVSADSVPGSLILDGEEMRSGDEFTFADVQAGSVTLEVEEGLAEPTPMELSYLDSTMAVGDAIELSVMIVPFSPATGQFAAPSLWLDGLALYQEMVNWPPGRILSGRGVMRFNLVAALFRRREMMVFPLMARRSSTMSTTQRRDRWRRSTSLSSPLSWFGISMRV